MRRADLAHLTSLTVGCALFAACGDSTSPVPRKVFAADAQAPNATTSWVNKGGSNCLAVTSQDTTPFPPLDSFGNTGWYFCPSQSSASLYLAKDPLNPGYSLNLGNISVLLGPEVPTSYNPDGSVATFTRTDSVTCDNGGTEAPIWTGMTTQNFMRSTYRCCMRYVCRTCTRITNAGGTGRLTANQPAPPPPPPPTPRSEEHTSELQSRLHLVCRLLLEKKKKRNKPTGYQKPKKTKTQYRKKRIRILTNEYKH